MVTKITVEEILSSKYPLSQRREIKEVKIRPRSFDEVIEPKGFLSLRDFTNLEYLLLENVPKMKGWDLSKNTKLQTITFSNSFFCYSGHEGDYPDSRENSFIGFPGGQYKHTGQGIYSLTLTFPNNPKLVKENIEIVGTNSVHAIFDLPTRKEKELEEENKKLRQQLSERVSPEELAELLQTQMDLQMNLEEKERENRLLREQLEEVLQNSEKEQLLARIEFPSQ